MSKILPVFIVWWRQAKSDNTRSSPFLSEMGKSFQDSNDVGVGQDFLNYLKCQMFSFSFSFLLISCLS